MPEDHPVKPIADALFSQSRATLDIKSMKNAGFIDPYPRKFTHVVVTRHPLLEGYVLKVYLDAQRYFKKESELYHWLNRITGAELIRKYIEENSLEEIFKVPQKWIYRLPDFPAPAREFLKKEYILIVEDMELVSREENKELWSSALVTPDLLHHIFTLLNTIGLHDCGSIENIPFTKDGRIAFIDTETYNSWPVNFKKLAPGLSKEMKIYWNQLVLEEKK